MRTSPLPPLRGSLRRTHRAPLVGFALLVAAVLTLTGCGGSSKDVAAFTADDLTALPQQDWITNGGTVFNQRYSPLDKINRSNVADLKGVWRIHLKSATAFKYSGETQPLVHNGIAYLSTGASDVFALDVEDRQDDLASTKAISTRASTPFAAAGRVVVSRSVTVASTSQSLTERSSHWTRVRESRSGARPSGTGERAKRSRAPPSTTTDWSSRGSPAASSESEAASPPTTPAPASLFGASTRSPAPVKSGTTRGRRTTTRGSTVALLSGRRRPSIRNSGCSTSRPATRHRTSTAATARATTCSRTRSSLSTRRRASTGGTSSRCTTTSGISTLPRR